MWLLLFLLLFLDVVVAFWLQSTFCQTLPLLDRKLLLRKVSDREQEYRGKEKNRDKKNRSRDVATETSLKLLRWEAADEYTAKQDCVRNDREKFSAASRLESLDSPSSSCLVSLPAQKEPRKGPLCEKPFLFMKSLSCSDLRVPFSLFYLTKTTTNGVYRETTCMSRRENRRTSSSSWKKAKSGEKKRVNFFSLFIHSFSSFFRFFFMRRSRP